MSYGSVVDLSKVRCDRYECCKGKKREIENYYYLYLIISMYSRLCSIFGIIINQVSYFGVNDK